MTYYGHTVYLLNRHITTFCKACQSIVCCFCLFTNLMTLNAHDIFSFVVPGTCSPKKQKKLIKIKEPSYNQALDKVMIKH